MTVNVAFISLSSCNGCQVSFLNIVPWLEESGFKLIACPFIDRKWEGEEVDIAVVEGSISNKEHLELVKKLRSKARKVLALGTCTVYGGIQGIRRLSKLYEDRFGAKEFTPEPVTPRAVTDVIEVDAAVPRCPPPEDFIKQALLLLSKSGSSEDAVKEREWRFTTVCSQCPRKMVRIDDVRLRVNFNPADLDPNICLLSQGVLCLGPVTMGGCGANCPKSGLPCAGCAGPTLELILVRGTRPVDKLSQVLASMSGKSVEEVRDIVVKSINAYLLHTFTSSSVIMLKKPSSRLLELTR